MKFYQQLLFFIISTLGQQQLVTYIPSPAYAGVSAIYLNTTNTFYFHSGFETQQNYLQGIQQIYKDQDSGVWRYKPSTNTVYPLPRAFYGSFLYSNRYYIFGGIGPELVMKDFWFYDIQGDYWQRIQTPNPISRRYSFAHTLFNFNNKTYFAVAGGKSDSYFDNLLDFYL
jgi:hypothetical protein